MTSEEIRSEAAEISAQVISCLNQNPSHKDCGPQDHILKALLEIAQRSKQEGFQEGIKTAAELVRTHDEVSFLVSGKRGLIKKTSTNIDGNSYAEGILSLLPQAKKI